jgi:hypothetical protein
VCRLQTKYRVNTLSPELNEAHYRLRRLVPAGSVGGFDVVLSMDASPGDRDGSSRLGDGDCARASSCLLNARENTVCNKGRLSTVPSGHNQAQQDTVCGQQFRQRQLTSNNRTRETSSPSVCASAWGGPSEYASITTFGVFEGGVPCATQLWLCCRVSPRRILRP